MMVDGLRVDIATGRQQRIAMTPAEGVRRDARRAEFEEIERIEEDKRLQRRLDLEALKTAEIDVLRRILGRLLGD